MIIYSGSRKLLTQSDLTLNIFRTERILLAMSALFSHSLINILGSGNPLASSELKTAEEEMKPVWKNILILLKRWDGSYLSSLRKFCIEIIKASKNDDIL